MSEQARVALVIGAGDSTGAAIARRFAKEGYIACVTRRGADKLASLVKSIEDAGGRAYGFGSDARKEDEVIALINQIERDVGPIEVLVLGERSMQHPGRNRAKVLQDLGNGLL